MCYFIKRLFFQIWLPDIVFKYSLVVNNLLPNRLWDFQFVRLFVFKQIARPGKVKMESLHYQPYSIGIFLFTQRERKYTRAWVRFYGSSEGKGTGHQATPHRTDREQNNVYQALERAMGVKGSLYRTGAQDSVQNIPFYFVTATNTLSSHHHLFYFQKINKKQKNYCALEDQPLVLNSI